MAFIIRIWLFESILVEGLTLTTHPIVINAVPQSWLKFEKATIKIFLDKNHSLHKKFEWSGLKWKIVKNAECIIPPIFSLLTVQVAITFHLVELTIIDSPGKRNFEVQLPYHCSGVSRCSKVNLSTQNRYPHLIWL